MGISVTKLRSSRPEAASRPHVSQTTFTTVLTAELLIPPKASPSQSGRQPHLLAYPQLAGIVDQRDGRRGQEFVAPPHGVQSRTFPQGDPICRRVQLRFHLGKNGPILEHLQIRRNDEVWEHRIRPGQILRHMLRVSQAEKTNLQLNVFPVQPPGQLLQKRLFLAVQDADVVPIKQNVCHAR